MRLDLDPASELPLYRQLHAAIARLIHRHELAAGTRLPSTRALAEDLGISRITVSNAYAELEVQGLIANRAGSGAYVQRTLERNEAPSAAPGEGWPLWQQELATRLGPPIPAAATRGDPVGHALIDLSSGLGDTALFPIVELQRTLRRLLDRQASSTIGYGPPQGVPELRQVVADLLASQGLGVASDNVLITSGSQQALALCSQLLIRPGDAVAVEAPTYGGALNLFRTIGARIVSVPVDENGLRVEALERALRTDRPRLLYTIPNFQNPSGTCLSSERRRRLLELAEEHSLPIIEDDYVGDLRYEGNAQPALKVLDRGGQVIYLSTFSKMLLPGLRVGFAVAEGPIFDALVRAKHGFDLATSVLLQHAVHGLVTVGRYQAHLRRSRRHYRRRRDLMCAAIRDLLPPSVACPVPRGGLFLWLELPPGIDSAVLAAKARTTGVMVAGGGQFYAEAADGGRFLRLNFAACPEDRIEEAISRLAAALERYDG